MVDRFADDWRSAGLDEQTAALLEYTEQLTRRPQDCGKSDVARLSRTGLSERAIHDAVQICSYFNYINRVADAVDVELEPEHPPDPRREP